MQSRQTDAVHAFAHRLHTACIALPPGCRLSAPGTWLLPQQEWCSPQAAPVLWPAGEEWVPARTVRDLHEALPAGARSTGWATVHVRKSVPAWSAWGLNTVSCPRHSQLSCGHAAHPQLPIFWTISMLEPHKCLAGLRPAHASMVSVLEALLSPTVGMCRPRHV